MSGPTRTFAVNCSESYFTTPRFVKEVGALWFCLSVCLLPAAVGDRVPMESRHTEGRVVKRMSGDFDLTNGFYRSWLAGPMTAGLAPYLGKYVEVEFSVIPDAMKMGGWGFYRIEHVTVIEETPENPEAPPIEVTITPFKKIFTTSEPIVAKVVLKNRSKQSQELNLTSSHAVLSQDYDKVFWLEPEHHQDPEKFYRFEGKPDLGGLKPGGGLVFTIESRWMAKPGRYDLNYALDVGTQKRDCFSEFVPVEVVADKERDRVAVLKSWLKKADPAQRTAIANELVQLGDGEVVDEFLEQIRSRVTSYREAHQFALRHGGEAGEKLIMGWIEESKWQEEAQELIRCICKSKNRLRLLGELMKSRHAVEIGFTDWVEHPRICDIAAAMLALQTSPQHNFPYKGKEVVRDAAVTELRNALMEKPQMFTGLAKNDL